MTTNDDMPPRQPDEDEPIEELLGDVLDLVDETVARITDAEVDVHLRKALSRTGNTGQVASVWLRRLSKPRAADLNCQIGAPANSPDHDAIADFMATQRENEYLSWVNAALASQRLQQEMLDDARKQARQIIADAQLKAETAANEMKRTLEAVIAARQQAEQIVTYARAEADKAHELAAKTTQAARDQAEQILLKAHDEAEQVIRAARSQQMHPTACFSPGITFRGYEGRLNSINPGERVSAEIARHNAMSALVGHGVLDESCTQAGVGVSATIHLGWLLAEHSNADKAAQLLRTLVDMGGNPDVHLARLLAEHGDADEAVPIMWHDSGKVYRDVASSPSPAEIRQTMSELQRGWLEDRARRIARQAAGEPPGTGTGLPMDGDTGAAPSEDPAAAAETNSGPEARGQFGISDVFTQLRPEFPDISISKIRFLEAEGLIRPTRSRLGYRRFSAADIERLRYILTTQRDTYLPLRVIRDRLADGAGAASFEPQAGQAAADLTRHQLPDTTEISETELPSSRTTA